MLGWSLLVVLLNQPLSRSFLALFFQTPAVFQRQTHFIRIQFAKCRVDLGGKSLLIGVVEDAQFRQSIDGI
ncbi:MAG: hypothetical protein DI635_07050 [Pseudoxanthomonas suwonensis]|nr:MAG: hypothetical protein DI635_07050 [Pseudoxanthomonas suwonensis]